jgi:flagella basal body P-ring formation protein FlgA
VVVTCAGPGADSSWRIFVPVRRAAAATAAPIRAAAPVAAKPELVIRRGDPVLIEAGTDGFRITREGTAAADAVAGARLPVRVVGAVQPVQAVAVANGRVTLPGWDR